MTVCVNIEHTENLYIYLYIPYSHFCKYPGPTTEKHTSFPNQGRDIYKRVNIDIQTLGYVVFFPIFTTGAAELDLKKIQRNVRNFNFAFPGIVELFRNHF